jgi:4-amino-4-deoxy-L-arabinose transferase-like glycosyltransferase
MRRLRYGRGFGHVFGLLFLARHPVFLLVLAAVVLVIWLVRRRR